MFSCREDAFRRVYQSDITQQVGYMVCDTRADNKRWEFLSPQYSALKELCWCPGESEARRELLMLQMVKTNPTSLGFLEFFPLWKDWHARVLHEYLSFCERVRECYQPLRHLPRGEFARKAKVIDVSPVLFAMYNNKKEDVHEFLSIDTDSAQLQKWLRLVVSSW